MGIWGASSALVRTLEVFAVEHWSGGELLDKGRNVMRGK